MIEQLVSKVFAARNAAHLEHWATGSYAQHVALGDFYDGVIDLVDKLVEAYQGNFGKIKVQELEDDEEGGILAMLDRDVVWINDHRTEIANGVAALENIVDELTGLYLSTIYKLRNLKMKSYGRRVAVAIDQLFNALFGGDEDETISSRAEKARRKGRRWGCVLCRILDWLDKDHCKNSIELEEGEKISE